MFMNSRDIGCAHYLSVCVHAQCVLHMPNVTADGFVRVVLVVFIALINEFFMI